MVNLFLELERLKYVLQSRGLDDETVEAIVKQAEEEITLSLREALDGAVELAVQSGVEKRSERFINELRPRPDAFILETESGITDFSEPPFPMLDRLIAGGKVSKKDGSIYKVIPVGGQSSEPRAPIHVNIFDAQKAMYAKRFEEAARQFNRIKPKGSKAKFRTATSKQDRSTQWVLPAKDKDFTEDLRSINDTLQRSHDEIIMDIIRSYEESF